MACYKGVVGAFIGLGKTRQSFKLSQGGKQFPPSGQGLVHIALVPHIEHQPVLLGVKHPVDGHSQLHSSQIGGQMPSGPGDLLQQKVAQFLTEAAVLTSLGGILGTITGIIFAEAISRISNVPVAISIPAVIIAIVFSMLIGIIFGFFPAVKAANLDPIVALRHE